MSASFYDLYINKVIFPVTPSKVDIKVTGNNKTVTLMNDGEINVLKNPGLSEISFDLLLPNVQYPFAKYRDGFKIAKHYLDILEDLKVNKKIFQFILSRHILSKTHGRFGHALYSTNIKVTLEDYTIKEDAKEGFDIVVSVKLKQYREYGTKTYKIDKKKKTKKKSSKRTAKSTNKKTTYKTKKGDTLWKIAKKHYGDGQAYTFIFDANKKKITNSNKIKPGIILTIPALKVTKAEE